MMNAKKWLLSVLFFILSLWILVELKYQIFPGNRHEVDYLVNSYIPSLHNQKYDTLIFGDSLAHNAFSSLKLKKNILDLTSNQAISMAGNYFLLERYLKHNAIPKEIYLFCIPDFLHNDLNQKYTYMYFESVFNNKNEINEIKAIKPNLYVYDENFDINKYFERRKESINLGGYKPPKRLRHININKKSLNRTSNYMNKQIQDKIINEQKTRNLLEDIPRTYLNKIVKFCKSNNIKFTVVIEPMLEKSNVIFNNSKWHSYLVKQQINYVNINDYYIFNNYYFRMDGTHIHGKANSYYQNLIDKHVLNIYDHNFLK